MFNRLIELQKKAYAKYSNFYVAAIVETDAGEFKGVNVENAVYPLTLCAERNAIFSAITAGAKKINHVHLITDTTDESGTPCGSCRQVMSEFMDSDGKITVYSKTGIKKEYTINELLPFSFGEKSLKK